MRFDENEATVLIPITGCVFVAKLYKVTNVFIAYLSTFCEGTFLLNEIKCRTSF